MNVFVRKDDMDNIPAFPSEQWDEKEGLEHVYSGMNLRDYFASHIKYNSKNHFSLSMKAKEKMMGKSCPLDEIESSLWWMGFEAKIRYLKADFMIKERIKNG